MLRTLVVLLLAAAAGGCSASDRGDGSEGGMALPQQRDGEAYPGDRVPVTGTVVLQPNGCFRLRTAAGTRLVVWPRGSRQDPQDGATVRLPSGEPLRDGDPVTGSGLDFPISGLTGVPDGYWGSVVTFCAPADATVLVLDDVRPA